MNLIPDAISVVIPTYNRAHLIKESIQSVLDQTLQPYEIIIVDDFSTDNTEEVVNSFNSPLIKFVKNQRKKGANGARNTGILMAQGEYIAFHDSDDICLNTKLEKQKKCIKGSIEICFCSMKRNYNGNKNDFFPYKRVKTDRIYSEIEKNNIISTQTILIKKSLAEEKLFDENLKRLQDWDFVLRAVNFSNTYHLHDYLVVQNINDSSISSTENAIDAFKKIYEKHSHLKNKGFYNKYIYATIINNKSILGGLKVYFYRGLRKLSYLYSRYFK